MSSEVAERLLTVEEFMDLPDVDNARTELLDGRVVCMPKPGAQHGRISFVIARQLDAFAEPNGLGPVMVESGFALRRRPDRVVAPDVAWVTSKRVPPEGLPTGAFERGPDLAVEVISPNDVDADVASKMLEYFAAGTSRVWHVRPPTRTVTVHWPNGDAHTYRAADVLTSNEAGFSIEGFSLPVADIFA